MRYLSRRKQPSRSATDIIFGLWSLWGTVLRGWALAESGDPQIGISELARGDERMRATGAIVLQPFVSAIARGTIRKDRTDVGEALELLNEALVSTHRTIRIGAMPNCIGCGRAVLAQGADATDVEAAFRQAIQLAQKQQAKVFELRAATSLARLWLKQGRTQESRLLLAPIYSWFTEGSETSDLRNSRRLLDASLSRLG